MSRKKIPYLSNDELMEEWNRWKKEGEISERMGYQMLTLARHCMESKKFCGYPQHVKDEIVSDGVVKIMNNLKNFKPERGSIFSYWTRCVFTAAITYLAKYYKDINTWRGMMIEALNAANANMPSVSPSNRELIRQLQRYMDLYGQGVFPIDAEYPSQGMRRGRGYEE